MTYELANRLWSYDPETGKLTWKVREKRVWPGKIAGYAFVSGRTSYFRVKYRCVDYLAHHIVWLLITGEWPDGEIDHEDGNGLNNRKDNLRDVTSLENDRNKRLASNNTSGANGVYWCAEKRRWRSVIRIDGELINLGSFRNKEEAIEARSAADKEYRFHELHGAIKLL